MANEISLTGKISATKSSVTVTNATSTKTQSMASTAVSLYHATQNIGLAREAVALGDVDNSNATGAEYFLLLYNRDSTNYVTVELRADAAAYYAMGVIRPGECWGPIRLNKLDATGDGGIWLTANVAACEVEVVACEAGDPAL